MKTTNNKNDCELSGYTENPLAENIREDTEFLLSKIIHEAFNMAKNNNQLYEDTEVLDTMYDEFIRQVGYYIDYYAENNIY